MTHPSTGAWAGADAYEAFMGRWSRPLARKFVDWLQPAAAAHWLDVGCGTGALTAAICAAGEPAAVLSCDPSEPFVEHARSQVAAATTGCPSSAAQGPVRTMRHRSIRRSASG